MRTTLDIADDVLAAARELGRRQRRSIGDVISDLSRMALVAAPPQSAAAVAEPLSFYGFEPLPARGVFVSDELIDQLRYEHGD